MRYHVEQDSGHLKRKACKRIKSWLPCSRSDSFGQRVAETEESAKPKTHFKLAIASTEFVLCPAAGQKVSLSLDGISAQYCGYEGRHDVQGEAGG